jgi:hypothetical protein
MSSNQRCDDCGGYIIPGQGKWVPPGPNGRRLHKSPELCQKATERSDRARESELARRMASRKPTGGI